MAADHTEAQDRANLASDSYVSRSVVDAKLATAEEVQACRAKQQKYREAGRPVKLADLMVKAGVVTKSQLRRMANPAEDSAGHSLQQIPGFQILQKIGSGAMASVYKARQLSLDRIVAIKILPKRLSEDPSFVERFEKEGQAAAKLSHNNIVQAIDVGEYGGYHYFVMEYVDGKTVYDEMTEIRRYSEERALGIATQICRALEHAHARGLIHRDVKPKNIIITNDRTAKLADMGLAREAGDTKKAAEEKGRAYGTPYYISPEQIRGVVDVDFRADIYSMGATLYHMITGRVPFEGPNPAAIMHKHLKEVLTPPDHLNSSISTGLAEVVERAMAKDRNARYQSTRDLLSDLELVQRGEAPLQARAGYDDKLLQDLAGGDESEEAFFEEEAGPGPGPPMSRPGYLTPLILGLILQFIVILVLVVALLAGS
jgi:serine/threonine-protein kinase